MRFAPAINELHEQCTIRVVFKHFKGVFFSTLSLTHCFVFFTLKVCTSGSSLCYYCIPHNVTRAAEEAHTCIIVLLIINTVKLLLRPYRLGPPHLGAKKCFICVVRSIDIIYYNYLRTPIYNRQFMLEETQQRLASGPGFG